MKGKKKMKKTPNENLPKWSDAERRILGTIVNNQSTPQLTFRPQNLPQRRLSKRSSICSRDSPNINTGNLRTVLPIPPNTEYR